MNAVQKPEIFKALQERILQLQGLTTASCPAINLALTPLRDAFPNRAFPLGAVHEFLCGESEQRAATCGFVAGLLSALMARGGVTVWVSAARSLFPPALKSFGLQPERFVFVDTRREKDCMWAIDEALKCDALTAVVGELQDLDFTTSRRLQLAVEQSKATGFVLRNDSAKLNATACVSRWRISSLPSETFDSLPGIGFPRWNVELLKIRNGKPGSWRIKWESRRFVSTNSADPVYHTNPVNPFIPVQKAG